MWQPQIVDKKRYEWVRKRDACRNEDEADASTRGRAVIKHEL